MRDENIKYERNYKDTMFRMIFSEKKELLCLYNALNGTNYTDTEEMEITTLENAIYMNFKNDISFLLYDYLQLYEHQSTLNPNMPLRSLYYISSLYERLNEKGAANKQTLVKLPTPQFVVFYNGTKEAPERSILKLSDAYLRKEKWLALELEVQMININVHNNEELMEVCQTLREYAVYVDKVRKYSKELGIEAAVEKTIEECIASGILSEFLIKWKAEAIRVSIFEFDQEEHDKSLVDIGREEGRAEGREEGRAEGRAESSAEMEVLLEALILSKLEQGKQLFQIQEEIGIYPERIKEIYDNVIK